MDEIKLNQQTADAIMDKFSEITGDAEYNWWYVEKLEQILNSFVSEQEACENLCIDKLGLDSGWDAEIDIETGSLEDFDDEIPDGIPSPDVKFYETKEDWENEIAKRMIEEYIKKGLPVKYESGAPHGWENGIAYKYELVILGDCIEWLEKEGKQ